MLLSIAADDGPPTDATCELLSLDICQTLIAAFNNGQNLFSGAPPLLYPYPAQSIAVVQATVTFNFVCSSLFTFHGQYFTV